jgi:hypothetical protein
MDYGTRTRYGHLHTICQSCDGGTMCLPNTNGRLHCCKCGRVGLRITFIYELDEPGLCGIAQGWNEKLGRNQ